MLLSSFGSETFQRSESEEEPNKLQEAIDRITRFVTWTKIHVRKRAARVSNYMRSLKSSNAKSLPVPPTAKSKLEFERTLSNSTVLQMENGKATKEGDEDRILDEDCKVKGEVAVSSLRRKSRRPTGI